MAGWVLEVMRYKLILDAFTGGWCSHFWSCCMHVCCRIWLERVRSLHELTSQGLSVVLTDLDAIWTKNPLPYLLKAAAGQQQGFDLIVSKGHFPSEVYKNFRVAGACRQMFRRASSWALWTGATPLQLALPKVQQR